MTWANTTPWTVERVEMLKRLWADGLSAGDIAAELGGVTRNGVIGKVHRLGLSGRTGPSAAPRPRKPRASGPAYRPSRLIMRTGTADLRINNNGKGDLRINNRATAPALQPAPEPELDSETVLAFADRKTLLQLGPAHCRWPVGNPGSGDFFFCGSDAVEGKPYCAYHCRVAYLPAGRVNPLWEKSS